LIRTHFINRSTRLAVILVRILWEGVWTAHCGVASLAQGTYPERRDAPCPASVQTAFAGFPVDEMSSSYATSAWMKKPREA
jgi:hypothetical protein